MKKELKGISLIILVIVIIIMIILAGAVILTLSSNDIVNKASNAVESDRLTKLSEAAGIKKAELMLNGDIREGERMGEAIERKLIEDGTIEADKWYISDDALVAELPEGYASWNLEKVNPVVTADNYLIPAPKGFILSNLPGENKLETGSVLYETTGTITENSKEMVNQYVWVPVKGDFVGNKYDNPHKENFVALKSSVEIYDGFYVSRYEISKDVDGNLQSMKNKVPWNNIVQGNDIINSINSTLASTFNGENEKTGHVIYGTEWDYICDWLAETGMDITKCSTRGNYSSTLKNTGESEAYNMNNIYDLAGNLFEITYQFIGAGATLVNGYVEYSGVRVILGGCHMTWLNAGDYNLTTRKQQGSHASPASYYPATGVRIAFNLPL